MIRFIIIRLSSVSDRRRIRQGLMMRSHSHHHHHLFLYILCMCSRFAKRPNETNALIILFSSSKYKTNSLLMIKMLSCSKNEREEKKRDVEERQMRVYLKCFCGGGGAFLSFYCAALN